MFNVLQSLSAAATQVAAVAEARAARTSVVRPHAEESGAGDAVSISREALALQRGAGRGSGAGREVSFEMTHEPGRLSLQRAVAFGNGGTRQVTWQADAAAGQLTREVLVTGPDGGEIDRSVTVSAAPPAAGDRVAASLQRMREAFFSVEGDESFDASVDLNGDGAVNHADLGMLRERLMEAAASERPPADGLRERIREAFFAVEGEDHFDASVDLNGDGVVNYGDLGLLRAREQRQVIDTPVDQAAELQQTVRDAFFATKGDERFDTAADLNGDGAVNYADLAMLRQKSG